MRELADYIAKRVSEKYLGFKRLSKKLRKQGVKSPEGLAAHIGRKKYGKKAFAKMGANARKKG